MRRCCDSRNRGSDPATPSAQPDHAPHHAPRNPAGPSPQRYCLYWELCNDIDIHNVAVHPDYRRHGVGRGMLGHVVREARRIGSQSITLEVRKSNVAAQALYRSLGFETCGVRKGYYSNDGEDAWVMILRLKS